jgi:hypothetical protein
MMPREQLQLRIYLGNWSFGEVVVLKTTSKGSTTRGLHVTIIWGSGTFNSEYIWGSGIWGTGFWGSGTTPS